MRFGSRIIQKKITYFEFLKGSQPMIRAGGIIEIFQSLTAPVFDYIRHKAYMSALSGQLMIIDLKSHAMDYILPDGCISSNANVALDEQKGFLFVGCGTLPVMQAGKPPGLSGKITVLDLNNDYQDISDITVDVGVDDISYNKNLSHLYLTSSAIHSFSEGFEQYA